MRPFSILTGGARSRSSVAQATAPAAVKPTPRAPASAPAAGQVDLSQVQAALADLRAELARVAGESRAALEAERQVSAALRAQLAQAEAARERAAGALTEALAGRALLEQSLARPIPAPQVTVSAPPASAPRDVPEFELVVAERNLNDRPHKVIVRPVKRGG